MLLKLEWWITKAFVSQSQSWQNRITFLQVFDKGVNKMRECGSAGLSKCKMRERKMREYIAGVRVICGRKMRERGNQ